MDHDFEGLGLIYLKVVQLDHLRNQGGQFCLQRFAVSSFGGDARNIIAIGNPDLGLVVPRRANCVGPLGIGI
jgi:hypothetical protein